MYFHALITAFPLCQNFTTRITKVINMATTTTRTTPSTATIRINTTTTKAATLGTIVLH